MNKIIEELPTHRRMTLCFSMKGDIISLEIDTAQLDSQERTDLVMGLYHGIQNSLSKFKQNESKEK